MISVRLSPALRLSISILSGAALALAYPDYNLPLLGWISFSGLMLCALGARPGLAALCGLLFGLTHYVISLPWIYTVLRQYGPLPAWQAGGLLGLLSLVCALYFGAFAALFAWVARRNQQLAILTAPFLWVTLEYVRTHVPDIGFPWNLLGYTASENLALLQIASVTGIFGLSLLVAGYNSLGVWGLLSVAERKRRGQLPGAAIVWIGTTIAIGAVAIFGGALVPHAQPTSVAHLVQTSLPQSMSYTPDWDVVHAGDMDELEQISIAAGRRQPGLVVWPEVPAPFSLQQGNFAIRAARIANQSRSAFVLGVVHWKSSGNAMRAFNSVAMLDPAGRPTFVYDKIHLVPFSEYIPWRNGLWFASDLTALISDFSTGAEYSVGQLPGGRFSVFICYEAIFPDQVRRYVANGAELLINVSNDGWFGRSSALAQHLAMARVRAAENRRWLLRDTNTGETVSVDPYGRIVARLPRYDRGVLDAPYAFRNDTSFYTRWGDWVAWVSMIVTMGLLAIAGFAGR